MIDIATTSARIFSYSSLSFLNLSASSDCFLSSNNLLFISFNISSTRSKFDLESSNFDSVSFFLSLYLDIPATSSIKTLNSSGLDSINLDAVPWFIIA